MADGAPKDKSPGGQGRNVISPKARENIADLDRFALEVGIDPAVVEKAQLEDPWNNS